MKKEIDKLEVLTEVCKEYNVSFSGAESNAIIAAMDRWQEVLNKNALLPDLSNSLVADIRNKLTPPLNLCAMIKDLPRPLTKDTDLNKMILKEVKQTEISIKYLSNL